MSEQDSYLFLLKQAFGETSSTSSPLDQFNNTVDEQWRKIMTDLQGDFDRSFQAYGGRRLTVRTDEADGYREEVVIMPAITSIISRNDQEVRTINWYPERRIKRGQFHKARYENNLSDEQHQAITAVVGIDAELQSPIETVSLGAFVEVNEKRLFVARYNPRGVLESLGFPYSWANLLKEQAQLQANIERQNTLAYQMKSMTKAIGAMLADPISNINSRESYLWVSLDPEDKLRVAEYQDELLTSEPDESIEKKAIPFTPTKPKIGKMPLSERLAVTLDDQQAQIYFYNPDHFLAFQASVKRLLPVSEITDRLLSRTGKWINLNQSSPLDIDIPLFSISYQG